jgi:RNase P/RNase MRP subunit p29
MKPELKNRVVAVRKYSTPGAWDFDLLPEWSYSIVYYNEEGKLSATSQCGGEAPVVDATPELKAKYAAHLAAEAEKEEAENRERELRTARLGRKVKILKGKNKDFVGIVKWVGETKYGSSALVIDEAGKKVFTKPTNVITLEEAPKPVALSVGLSVKVGYGQHSGKVGTITWVGETRYGTKAKIQSGEEIIWANPRNLELAAA